MLVIGMNNKEQQIPAIRFKGFTDAWEQRKLKDLALFNPKSILPEEFEYVDLESVSGTTMVSHRTETNGNAPSRAQRLAVKGDVFYQTVRPYQKNNYLFDLPYDNYVFSTGYAQLRPYGDSYFLLSRLQEERFVLNVLDRSTGTSYPAINSNDLAQIEINVPFQTEEQSKIGDFFKQLDNIIALHQRQLDNFKELKKAMLQKMFPQNGEKVPEVRFEGFTEGWEQRKLGEWIVPYAEKTNRNNQYPVLTSSRRGIFLQTDYYNGNQVASEDNTGYNIVPRGYFTYRHMSDDEIFKFNINDIVDYGIVSTLYPVFTTKQGLDSDFLQYQLNNGGEFRSYATLQKQGGSRTYMYLSKLENLKLTIPELQEQIKISNFFNQLDQSINLHQQKVNDYQQIKKAMLQKMFV